MTVKDYVTSMARPAAVFGLLALAAGVVPHGASAADGAQAYARHCGDCHSPRAIQAWLRREPHDGKRKVWLEGLLAKHYPPPAEVRTAIIDHIAAQKK